MGVEGEGVDGLDDGLDEEWSREEREEWEKERTDGWKDAGREAGAWLMCTGVMGMVSGAGAAGWPLTGVAGAAFIGESVMISGEWWRWWW